MHDPVEHRFDYDAVRVELKMESFPKHPCEHWLISWWRDSVIPMT